VRTAAIIYLVVMLVIPLIVIVRDGLREGIGELVRQVTLPVAANALYLTFWTAGIMTVVTAIMGTLTAYVLVRYRFPGQGLLNAIVDLPLAIPTLVTGVMLVVLYGPQTALGGWLKAEWGISIIFAPPAIILALLFVTFPFVVRAVEPVLRTLDLTQESAAATLGASAFTIFRRITLPPLILPLVRVRLGNLARS
jgi:sulfate/thiosulfate transport system permease protein